MTRERARTFSTVTASTARSSTSTVSAPRPLYPLQVFSRQADFAVQPDYQTFYKGSSTFVLTSHPNAYKAMPRFAARQHDPLRTATGRRHHLNLLLHDYDLVSSKTVCLFIYRQLWHMQRYTAHPMLHSCRRTTRRMVAEAQVFYLESSCVSPPQKLLLRRKSRHVAPTATVSGVLLLWSVLTACLSVPRQRVSNSPRFCSTSWCSCQNLDR